MTACIRNMRHKGREGSALCTVIIIILAVSGLLTIVIKASTQQVYSSRKLADRVRARMIAEAGVHDAYHVMVTNFYEARSNEDMFPLTHFGGGTYDVTITAVSNKAATITSVGKYSASEETVILDVMDFSTTTEAQTGPPQGTAWEHTIFAEDEFYLNGNGDVDGSIHSNLEGRFNGNLEITPGPIHVYSPVKIRVNGNALTPGSLNAPIVQITGNNEEPIDVNIGAVAYIPFPVVDLTELYNIADANGQVINGNSKGKKTYNNDVNWTGVPGGVKWLNCYNRVRFKGNITYDCIIVCTGGIQIDGNSNWDNPGDEGALFSRDKWIKINGNCEVVALLHAPQDITLGGNVRLYGQIISGADVDINGNVDIVQYAYGGWGGGGGGNTNDIDPEIAMTAWQK